MLYTLNAFPVTSYVSWSSPSSMNCDRASRVRGNRERLILAPEGFGSNRSGTPSPVQIQRPILRNGDPPDISGRRSAATAPKKAMHAHTSSGFPRQARTHVDVSQEGANPTRISSSQHM